MHGLSLKEVEHTAFRLAKEHLSWNEPIPEFSSRFTDKLESCIAMPFFKMAGQYVYPTLLLRASVLFYLIIKNHPFQNGNKRIAITTLLVFLHKNKKWIKADTQSLYNFTVWVAQSPAELKDSVILSIEDYLKKYSIDLTDLDV